MTAPAMHRYKSTESKYKGGAKEMYVTYDLWQETRGDNRALYPKVKRVYVAGDVTNWQVGTFKKRSGKDVYGVKIDYEQSREAYTRKGYKANRGDTKYEVSAAKVVGGKSHFSKIVEVPQEAEHIAFHSDNLPEKYQDALQAVR